MRKNEKEIYATQNLYEASYIMSKGFKLEGKTFQGEKICIGFSGKGVKEASLEFYSGAKISAKSLFDSYRTIKDYVFQSLRQGEKQCTK